MRRSLLLPTAVLAGALLSSCGEQPGPAEPATLPQPSLRTEQNSNGKAALITHDEQGALFFVDDDPAPGLSMLIGWTFAELNLFCSTGELTIGALKELIVQRNDSSVHQVVHAAQVPLLVWEKASGDLCGELLELPHLTGTGQMSITDNDLFVSGNRTEAAHVGIHGQVASEAGELFHLVGNWHGRTLRGSDEQVSTSDFRLVPVGP